MNQYQVRLSKLQLNAYLGTLLIVGVSTLIAKLLFPYFDAANLSMIFLAGVVMTAIYYGRSPSIVATILSVGLFDYLFIKPYGTFVISDVQYVLTLVVMLLVAISVSSLAVQSKEQ